MRCRPRQQIEQVPGPARVHRPGASHCRGGTRPDAETPAGGCSEDDKNFSRWAAAPAPARRARRCKPVPRLIQRFAALVQPGRAGERCDGPASRSRLRQVPGDKQTTELKRKPRGPVSASRWLPDPVTDAQRLTPVTEPRPPPGGDHTIERALRRRAGHAPGANAHCPDFMTSRSGGAYTGRPAQRGYLTREIPPGGQSSAGGCGHQEPSGATPVGPRRPRAGNRASGKLCRSPCPRLPRRLGAGGCFRTGAPCLPPFQRTSQSLSSVEKNNSILPAPLPHR